MLVFRRGILKVQVFPPKFISVAFYRTIWKENFDSSRLYIWLLDMKNIINRELDYSFGANHCKWESVFFLALVWDIKTWRWNFDSISKIENILLSTISPLFCGTKKLQFWLIVTRVFAIFMLLVVYFREIFILPKYPGKQVRPRTSNFIKPTRRLPWKLQITETIILWYFEIYLDPLNLVLINSRIP